MPIIRVEMWPGRTLEQKRELVAVLTREVVRIAKTKPEAVTIVIEEIAQENWAEGGRLSSDPQ